VHCVVLLVNLQQKSNRVTLEAFLQKVVRYVGMQGPAASMGAVTRAAEGAVTGAAARPWKREGYPAGHHFTRRALEPTLAGAEPANQAPVNLGRMLT